MQYFLYKLLNFSIPNISKEELALLKYQENRALHTAMQLKNWEEGGTLLRQGFNPCVQDAQGNLPLHLYWWSRTERTAFFPQLIAMMEVENFQKMNKSGETPIQDWLSRALVLNNALCPLMDIQDLAWELKQMKAKDCNLLDANAKGHTLLHDLVYYVPSEHINSKEQSEYIQQLVKLLIAEGVPSDTKNSLDLTPKDVARILGYQDLVLALGGKPFDQTSDLWQTQNAKAEAKLLQSINLTAPVAINKPSEVSHLNLELLKALFKIYARPRNALNAVFQIIVLSFPDTISPQLSRNLYEFIESGPEGAWRALDEQGNTILYYVVLTVIKKILNEMSVSKYDDFSKAFDCLTTVVKSFLSEKNKPYLNKKNKFGVSPQNVWIQWLHQPNNSLKDDFFTALWSQTLFLNSDRTLPSPISQTENKPFPFLALPLELQRAILLYFSPHRLFQMRGISKSLENDINSLTFNDTKHYFASFYQSLYSKYLKKNSVKTMTVKDLLDRKSKIYTLTYLIAPEYLESFYRSYYLSIKLKQVKTKFWEFQDSLDSCWENPVKKVELQQKLLAWPTLFPSFEDYLAIQTMDEKLYRTLFCSENDDGEFDEGESFSFKALFDVLQNNRSMALLVLTNPMSFNIFQELLTFEREQPLIQSDPLLFEIVFINWIRDEETALAALMNQRFQAVLLNEYSEARQKQWLQTILFASIQQQLECPVNERSVTYDWVGGNGASALHMLTDENYRDTIAAWSLEDLQHAQTLTTTQLEQNTLQTDAQANLEKIVSRLNEIITSYQHHPTKQLAIR